MQSCLLCFIDDLADDDDDDDDDLADDDDDDDDDLADDDDNDDKSQGSLPTGPTRLDMKSTCFLWDKLLPASLVPSDEKGAAREGLSYSP
ncbi:hypothetical protein E4U21_000805 [Claviceps maximensis]|nr:hypothetical protein E4U21_000805 [Claviceps maximensis]